MFAVWPLYRLPARLSRCQLPPPAPAPRGRPRRFPRPCDEQVVLRSPLAPPELATPYERYTLEGPPATLAWFAGLYCVRGTTAIVEQENHYDPRPALARS